jgi:hypothetical protein
VQPHSANRTSIQEMSANTSSNKMHPAPITALKHRDGNFYASFDLKSHSPEGVAIAVQYYVAQPPNALTKVQCEALSTYHSTRARTDIDPEDPDLLLKFFSVFDDLFFRGAIKIHTSLKVVTELSGALGDYTYLWNGKEILTTLV